MIKHIHFVFALLSISLKAQLPAIGASTILPSSLHPNSFVKIATKVTTPSQGVLVDQSFSVTQNPARISLKICYGSGLLPATHTYVDTFSIGQLPAGVYTLSFKAYMTSANQHCAKIDSNEVISTVNVNAFTFIQKNEDDIVLDVYPNPVQDFLDLHFEGETIELMLYQADGKMLRHGIYSQAQKISLEGFEPGLYYLQVKSKGAWRRVKLVKE